MTTKGFSQQCNMGMGRLADPTTLFKRKFRWMFRLVGGSNGQAGWIGEGINALPPLKGGRPSLEFKDIEVQHVTEDIYLPGKPSWKPVTFTLYDINCTSSALPSPIWTWVTSCYDAFTGDYYPILDNNFKQNCCLELYSGCGDTLERWFFENAWPSQINWGELDMSNSEVVTCEITLKYDRAYLCIDSSCCVARGGSSSITAPSMSSLKTGGVTFGTFNNSTNPTNTPGTTSLTSNPTTSPLSTGGVRFPNFTPQTMHP